MSNRIWGINKIMRMLNFPDRFKKKGRLAYYKMY